MIGNSRMSEIEREREKKEQAARFSNRKSFKCCEMEKARDNRTINNQITKKPDSLLSTINGNFSQ